LAVATHSAAELRELDAGSWRGPEFAGTRLSTLAETLGALPNACFMIERKTGSAAVCVDLLTRLKAFDRTIVQAFDHSFLEECRRLSPQILLGALGEKELSDAALERAHAFGMAVIGWKAADWTAEAVARTHRAGFKAWAWTVDEPAEAERLLAAGIDALISNAPERIKEVVARTPRR
jgi:glycerophosphoryl diester phosphodiesterase